MKVVLLLVVLNSYAACAQSSLPGAKISTTSANQDTSKHIRMRCCGGLKSPPPLFILNGYVVSDSTLSEINPQKIKSIDILKNDAAVALYGPLAKNGVVKITAKQSVVNNMIRHGFIKPAL